MKKLKSVLTIWIIIYFLITALFYLLNSWLNLMPLYLRTLLLSGIMVFGMQYMILPGLQQLRNNKLTNSKNGNTRKTTHSYAE